MNPFTSCALMVFAGVMPALGAVAVIDETPVPALIQQLKDKDEFVRLKAAKLLGNLGVGAKDAVPALTEALKDSDPDVQEVAKQALAKIKAAMAAGDQASAIASLEKNLKAIKDMDSEVRQKGAKGLGTLLTNPDDIIRIKACQALSELGIDAEPAMDALKEAVKDEDEAVRKLARRALEKLEEALVAQKKEKAREAIAPHLKDLKSPYPETRIRALEKIGSFGVDASVAADKVVEMMTDRMPAVRNAASEALEKVAPAIQPHVFQLLHGQGKYQAIQELQKLGGEAKSSLPALVYTYQMSGSDRAFGGGQGMATLVVEAMVKVAPNEKVVAQVVLNSLTTGKLRRVTAVRYLDSVELTAKEKVSALLAALQEELKLSGPRRGEPIVLIDSLAKMGKDAAAALPLLKQLKFVQDDEIRAAAVKALEAIE